MGQIICIVNQKGGVGKTTTCVNLSASLAVLGQKILVIDLDPQANATTASMAQAYPDFKNIASVLLGEHNIVEAIVVTPAQYALIPGNSALTATELHLLHNEQREYCLSKCLAEIRDDYDYILLDCPPSLTLLTVNALAASDSVIVPVQCEYLALEGLSSLIRTIEETRETINPKLYIHGLLRTLFDGRNSLSRQVSEELLLHFKTKVYDTIIPRNIRLAEAPSYGQPILIYDPQAAGSLAYLQLAQEILIKDGRTQTTQEQLTATGPLPLLRQRASKPESMKE